MRIGLAQTNPVIGDFSYNLRRIVDAYRECVDRGAELVISPEMCLSGYPPRDLVYRTRYVPQCREALDYLAREVGKVPLLVGYVDFNDQGETGRPFRNGAALLQDGSIRHRVFKTLLPTYDVFDEQRWFEPAEESLPIEINGVRLGVTICEDIWMGEYLERQFYHRNPVADLAAKGIDILLNLSASPFNSGKPEQRRAMLCEVATQYGVPLVYCNQVGGNDELVFDGHSAVIDAQGNVLAQLPGFRTAELVVDVPLGQASTSPDSSPAQIDFTPPVQQLHDALVLGLRDYASKTGFDSVCLGLSGGIDSALVATLACEAFGPENVLGLTMPSPYSSRGSVEDSFALARNMGMRCEEVAISPVFEAAKASLSGLFAGHAEDVTEENIQARIRGLFLMAAANKFGHLLLTTGNKSELAVGYCTIYGDMCGGLAVISDLPKTRVYELSRWINRDREVIPWNTIDKAPSAELRPDQKDQDTLPPYDVLDAILELLVDKQVSATDVILSYGFDESTVRWIQRRIDINEWKREQAAPGIRVTTKAFGVGRRMPIAQRFRD